MDISQLKIRYLKAKEAFIRAEMDYINCLEASSAAAKATVPGSGPSSRSTGEIDSIKRSSRPSTTQTNRGSVLADITNTFEGGATTRHDLSNELRELHEALSANTETTTTETSDIIQQKENNIKHTRLQKLSSSIKLTDEDQAYQEELSSELQLLKDDGKDEGLGAHEDVILSQVSEKTVDHMSSSPIPLKGSAGSHDSGKSTGGGDCSLEDSIPLNDAEAFLNKLSTTKMKHAAPSGAATPTPMKRRRFSTFRDEIDEDLLSGHRHTTFQRLDNSTNTNTNVHLITPKSASSSGGKGTLTAVKPAMTKTLLDSWLKPASKESPMAVTTPTPKFCGGVKTNVNPAASTELNFGRYEDFYNHAVEQTWNKTDFIVNPDSNDNLSHAFQSTLRGKKRTCVHGRSCTQCSRFYELAGDFSSSATDGVIKRGSRHRSKWAPQESPPGFWRTDFPNTQQAEDDAAEREVQLQKQTHERLLEALTPHGRFIFKDLTYRKEMERLWRQDPEISKRRGGLRS